VVYTLEACNSCSSGNLNQIGSRGLRPVCPIFPYLCESLAKPNLDSFCGLVPQSDLHAIDAVDSGVPCRSTPQNRHSSIWNKPHMHEMILYRVWKIECDQHPALADLQFTQYTQPSNPSELPEWQNI